MFDAFLKSKFHTKCKTAIKLTKKRVEMIKKKRNAVEKFLKKDIVDLLKDGLDINAYGRAEGFLIELNMSACYDFLMQFCVSLYKQVSLMDKQRDCPEECKEAVQSLMYAAARFADMPELRELRAIFLEKYGNFEANINQEFVEKLKTTPPTKGMKIQLLQNIALELGKTWDSKALEQKLYAPPSSEYGLSEDTKNGIVDKMKKEIGNNRRGSSVPSSPRRIKDLSSYWTRKTNEDRYKPQENENKNEHMNESSSEREKKPFQSKFAPPPPYHMRSSSEVKYKLQANGNNVVQGSDFGNMQNNEIRGNNCNKNEEPNTPRSGKKGHEGENDEIKNYQRKFASVKSNEKQHFQSKFAPPAHYMEPKAETFLIEEKTLEQSDSVEKAKAKPKSVRSVRSNRSMVSPNGENNAKIEHSLDAIRRELATKPGHKSSNVDEDLRDMNEVLMHGKTDSPRSGKGLQFRR